MVILFLVIGIVGCKSEDLIGKEIVAIKLVCSELCKKTPNTPFYQKILTDVDEIKIFKRSISKAVKMKGELNYGAMFMMYVSFEDSTQKKFVLNVDNEAGHIALLVDTADSGQGYEIPKDQTNELRKIIYND